MSEHEFHVHGHHEHVVEHESQHGGRLSQYVAIFTAIMSTIGAIISFQGNTTQNEAMLYKNEAVYQKTQASDEWNYYQAKAQKGHLMELATDLAPKEKKAYYRKQLEKYAEQKKAIKAKAEALDDAALKANEKSEVLMRPHNRLAFAMTLTQIAISLASITVLTRRRWLLVLASIAAGGGCMLWGVALLS